MFSLRFYLLLSLSCIHFYVKQSIFSILFFFISLLLSLRISLKQLSFLVGESTIKMFFILILLMMLVHDTKYQKKNLDEHRNYLLLFCFVSLKIKMQLCSMPLVLNNRITCSFRCCFFYLVANIMIVEELSFLFQFYALCSMHSSFYMLMVICSRGICKETLKSNNLYFTFSQFKFALCSQCCYWIFFYIIL